MQVLAKRLPITPIFQNMTFIHYVQRLENVTKIAKFNLPGIYDAILENFSCQRSFLVACSIRIRQFNGNTTIFIFRRFVLVLNLRNESNVLIKLIL